MSDVRRLSERIDALEMRLTFQDETIETLNQTITAQWQQIDSADAPGRRTEASACRRPKANAPGPANEPPPHY